MSKRYSISRGRNSDGSTCYGIEDSMPGAGTDGHVIDSNDRAYIEDYCERLNHAHETNSRVIARNNNREWRYNGRCYSWEPIRPATPAFYD